MLTYNDYISNSPIQLRYVNCLNKRKSINQSSAKGPHTVRGFSAVPKGHIQIVDSLFFGSAKGPHTSRGSLAVPEGHIQIVDSWFFDSAKGPPTSWFFGSAKGHIQIVVLWQCESTTYNTRFDLWHCLAVISLNRKIAVDWCHLQCKLLRVSPM